MVVSFMNLVANDATKSMGCRMEIHKLAFDNAGEIDKFKTQLLSACHNRDISVVFGQSPTQVLISKGNAIVVIGRFEVHDTSNRYHDTPFSSDDDDDASSNEDL